MAEMWTIQLTPDGTDLVLPARSLFIDGKAAALQLVVARLRLLLGECQEDPGLGRNYREGDAGIIAAEIKAIILGTTDEAGAAVVSSCLLTSVDPDSSGVFRVTGTMIINGDTVGLTVNL